MKAAIVIVCFSIGALLGWALIGLVNGNSGNDRPTSPVLKSSEKTRPEPHTGWSLIKNSSEALQGEKPFEGLARDIDRERRSPLRTSAFLKLHIAAHDTATLVAILREGGLGTSGELEEVATRLVREDPELAFSLFYENKIRFRTMEDLYAFSNRMLETWVREGDPEDFLKRLSALPRGGSQMDSALRFSKLWAENAPNVAAENFDELVRLRNFRMSADGTTTDNEFANVLVSAWSKKDENELRQFVLKNPESPLGNAFRKLENQQVPK